MIKYLWFAQYERLRTEFEDEYGREPNRTEDDYLAERAFDRLRDLADGMKKRMRGE